MKENGFLDYCPLCQSPWSTEAGLKITWNTKGKTTGFHISSPLFLHSSHPWWTALTPPLQRYREATQNVLIFCKPGVKIFKPLSCPLSRSCLCVASSTIYAVIKLIVLFTGINYWKNKTGDQFSVTNIARNSCNSDHRPRWKQIWDVIWESKTKQVYNHRIGASWSFLLHQAVLCSSDLIYVFYSCRAKVFVKKNRHSNLLLTRDFLLGV